jgi:hypothetical protein
VQTKVGELSRQVLEQRETISALEREVSFAPSFLASGILRSLALISHLSHGPAKLTAGCYVQS